MPQREHPACKYTNKSSAKANLFDFAERKYIGRSQIYENNDLIADVEMPSYFKLLGYKDGYYYGARFIPVEEMETTSLVLYKIKLDDLNGIRHESK